MQIKNENPKICGTGKRAIHGGSFGSAGGIEFKSHLCQLFVVIVLHNILLQTVQRAGMCGDVVGLKNLRYN